MNAKAAFTGLSHRLRVLSAASATIALLSFGSSHTIQSLVVAAVTLIYHVTVFSYELRAHKTEGGLSREYTSYSAYPAIAGAGLLFLSWLLDTIALIIGMVISLAFIRFNVLQILNLLLEVGQVFVLGAILQTAVYERRHGAPGAVTLGSDA
ncbi:hypothetical protein HDZ31DRAFT_61200 [Schizophyllum fasciatum]